MIGKTLTDTTKIKLLLGRSPSMKMVHNLASTALVWVVGLHLAVHWNWVVSAVRRYVIAPLRGGSDRAAGALAAAPATTTEQY